MANKYWYGGSTNNPGDWTWDSSKQDTVDNAAAVDKGGSPNAVGIPVTGTIFAAGESVTIAGTTNYNGTYTLTDATTANEIVIESAYTAETFAGTETVTTNESNWHLTSDGSDTTKPAAADVIYFNNRAADNATTGKKQSADTNIDGASTGTPDIGGMYVTSTFTGDIGTSSEYLELEADGNDIIIEGTGSVYLKLSAGTGNDADCGRLVVNNSAGTVYLASLENDGSNVSLFALILVMSGTLNIDADTAVTKMIAIGSNTTVVASTGITNNLTSTDAVLIVKEATVTWDSPFNTLDNYAGTFNWGSDGMTPTAGLDGTLLTNYPSARFNWQTADTATSILKQFIAYGGTIDAARAINSGYAKEIGSGSEMSEVWPGATVKLNNGNRNITIAAGSDIESFGGSLVMPEGAIIDW